MNNYEETFQTWWDNQYIYQLDYYKAKELCLRAFLIGLEFGENKIKNIQNENN